MCIYLFTQVKGTDLKSNKNMMESRTFYMQKCDRTFRGEKKKSKWRNGTEQSKEQDLVKINSHSLL